MNDHKLKHVVVHIIVVDVVVTVKAEHFSMQQPPQQQQLQVSFVSCSYNEAQLIIWYTCKNTLEKNGRGFNKN